MTSSPSVLPQPMIAVADVERSAAWYRALLGADSGHGGSRYEQLLVGGRLVLQLHRDDAPDHHGPLADPDVKRGNGVLLWFALAGFDAAVARARELGAEVVADVHVNPNADQRELWLRDLDGFGVVLAEATEVTDLTD